MRTFTQSQQDSAKSYLRSALKSLCETWDDLNALEEILRCGDITLEDISDLAADFEIELNNYEGLFEMFMERMSERD